MVSAVGSSGSVSGLFIHGTVSRPSSAAPGPTSRPLLRPVLRQVRHSASGGHGAGAGAGSPVHTQKEEGLDTVYAPCLGVSVTPSRTLASSWVSVSTLNVCLILFMGEGRSSFTLIIFLFSYISAGSGL